MARTTPVSAALPAGSNPVAFDSRQAQEFLAGEAAGCDLVVFALSGTRLASTALHRIAARARDVDGQCCVSDTRRGTTLAESGERQTAAAARTVGGPWSGRLAPRTESQFLRALASWDISGRV